jgi:HK97 family phage major capsid protein
MDEKLMAELANIKSGLETKTALEVKNAIEAFEVKLTATNKAQFETELKAVTDALEAKFTADLKVVQDHADKLDVKLQEKPVETKSGGDVLQKAIAENFDAIKTVTKGRSQRIETKDVGNMTVANNLTGSSVITYQSGLAVVPSQKVNFADLIPTVNSSTGTYVLYRETGSEGSISSQGTPGAAKTQIDYDMTAVTYNATYISGFARYAKQMAQDLPFLTSFLPTALRRDYFKAENSIFYTAFAAAIPTLTTIKVATVEKVIDAIAQLETLNYDVNGIVVNPSVWMEIALTKTTSGDYTLPGVVTLINGNLSLNGVPVYKASWVAANTVLVGDWTMAKKVLVDGLAVEFFEQDADNVTKNLITARVESRTVLAIDRTDAFFKFTITPVSV